MKVAITTPGRFPPAFHAARYHQQRGELARIISPVPASRTAQYGVFRRRTVAMAPLGAWNRAAQRVVPRTMQPLHQAAFSAAFDAAASRALSDSDVVNAWCSTALRTIRAAHRRGIPAVLEVASAHIQAQVDLLEREYRRHGAEIDRAVVSPRVIARTLREYEEADAIVVMSSFARRTFIERGVPAAKVIAIAPGVDPLPPLARISRDEALRILFVGGTSLRKGIPYLLDAFRTLSTRAELRLVGARNDALVARCGGMPDGAVATGPLHGEALAAEYASADIFVLPSVEDGWGLVTTEAMAAGLPVIVSDHAGSADIVRDGYNGFVVPARDAAALAGRINILVADEALRTRMGEAARRTASARTWQTYGDERHELVYRPLLGLRDERRTHALAA